jgi:predicted dehydrogenase
MALRLAQIGTKHGHAHGKAVAMLSNPAVEVAGLWEPDEAARRFEQERGRYGAIRWYRAAEEVLDDPTIVAVAIEGRNSESLAMAQAAVAAGKHLWYDKPGGDDWPGYQALIEQARARGLLVQMGYMFRYQPGFQQVSAWTRSGLLGRLTSVRAHMSTNIPLRATQSPLAGANTREGISQHQGGVFYDLGGHMLDQVVWLLGRPVRASAVLRNDATPEVPDFMDNTLGVFEFEQALAFVDISAMEPRPTARRFEVYGTRGSAILEPFDPCEAIRLALDEPGEGYPAGETRITPPLVERQAMYERELAAFVATLEGRQAPDRSYEHELLVQETLLRATGRIT